MLDIQIGSWISRVDEEINDLDGHKLNSKCNLIEKLIKLDKKNSALTPFNIKSR